MLVLLYNLKTKSNFYLTDKVSMYSFKKWKCSENEPNAMVFSHDPKITFYVIKIL